MSLEIEGKDLKKWLTEDIGVYSENSLIHHLTSLEEIYPYRFSNYSDLNEFHCWILAQRPQMVIIEGKLLDGRGEGELVCLKETLARWGIISLIVCDSLNEIRCHRNSGWPLAHFFRGPVVKKDFQDKVINILNERYTSYQPCIGVISKKTYLLSHLEMLLRNYGIRIKILSLINDIQNPIQCDHPEALLCDFSELENGGESLLNEINEFTTPFVLPVFMVSEEKGGAIPEKILKYNHVKPVVYSVENFDFLLYELLETIYEKRRLRLEICRDQKTGLFLRDTFIQVAKKEQTLALRRGEEFSILKLALASLNAYTDKFGEIFTHSLEMTLGLFVQNRVRSSDFIAQGKKGEILVLLPRIGRRLATLIGERLCHRFAQEASFQDNGLLSTLFKPELVYQAFSYPHDFRTSDDLIAAIDGAGIYGQEQEKLKTG